MSRLPAEPKQRRAMPREHERARSSGLQQPRLAADLTSRRAELFECWRTRRRPSKCSPRQQRCGSDLLLLADDDVGGVGMLHADDVVAGIDVMDLAGAPAREVGEEVDRG